jgi:hypothetical protein
VLLYQYSYIAAVLPFVSAADSCRSAAAYGLVPLKISLLPPQSANFAAAERCRLPLPNVCMCLGATISTAADCRCVENNSCLNVVGKTLFNPGQQLKDTLVTVECPDTLETTNYCNTEQLNVCCKYNHRRLPLQCCCCCRCMRQKHCCGKIPLPDRKRLFSTECRTCKLLNVIDPSGS